VQPPDLAYEEDPLTTIKKWKVALGETIIEPGARISDPQQLLNDIRRQTFGCKCVKRLTLTAHAWEGYINLPGGMQITEDMVKQQIKCGINPSQSAFKDAHALLLKIKPYLCKGATVDFAQCMSGWNSPNLEAYLKQVFGPDVKVVIHSCYVEWQPGGEYVEKPYEFPKPGKPK
jgi:hypothetical protein